MAMRMTAPRTITSDATLAPLSIAAKPATKAVSPMEPMMGHFVPWGR